MLAALRYDGLVIFMEHKLLSESWLESLGSGGRSTVAYDMPTGKASSPVPREGTPIPIAEAAIRKVGSDITVVSVGVGVHRALEAATKLENDSISVEVIDLRTVSPLDQDVVRQSVSKTGKLLVVDEDYEQFGLSGELAAIILKAGIPFIFGRVCTRSTIPYARHLEDDTLPNVRRIIDKVYELMEN